MIWLLLASFIIISLILYCLGGQTTVWTRRYLLPALQSLLTLAIGYYLGTPWYISLVPLLWIGIWVLPAGKDAVEDVLMGLEASFPIFVAITMFHVKLCLIFLIPAICVAFVPNLPATNIGKTGKQILWRDVLRSGVLAISWLTVLWLK